jgi:hypothetical protein
MPSRVGGGRAPVTHVPEQKCQLCGRNVPPSNSAPSSSRSLPVLPSAAPRYPSFPALSLHCAPPSLATLRKARFPYGYGVRDARRRSDSLLLLRPSVAPWRLSEGSPKGLRLVRNLAKHPYKTEAQRSSAPRRQNRSGARKWPTRHGRPIHTTCIPGEESSDHTKAER